MKSYEFTAVNILQKYNFTKEDAEAFLETIKEAKQEDNASKSDIKRVEERIVLIDKEIDILKKDILDLRRDIRQLDVKIESSKNETLRWTFVFWVSQLAIIFAMFKYFMDK